MGVSRTDINEFEFSLSEEAANLSTTFSHSNAATRILHHKWHTYRKAFQISADNAVNKGTDSYTVTTYNVKHDVIIFNNHFLNKNVQDL